MKRTFGMLSLALAMTAAVFGQATSSTQNSTEKLSHAQLVSLIGTAKTPAEHRRISTYYKVEAQKLLAESKEHAQMAEQYKLNPVTSSSKYATGTVNHCEYIATSLKADSEKMQELAEMHEQMAKDAEKK